jgi:hypothetical protein
MTADGSFWTSLPGVLTALAGLIAAIGSLVGVLYSTGALGKSRASNETAKVVQTTTPVAPDPGSATTVNAPQTAHRVEPTAVVLRGAPAILSSDKMDLMLVRLGFFDARRNPVGQGIEHRYEIRADAMAAIVVDEATGLTWEMRGSPNAMPFDDAAAHIDQLNVARAAGFADWRVPTAEETMSLMEPEAIDGFHVAAAFRRGGAFVWTADQEPGGERGWVVYFSDGTIEAERRVFNAWVRGVR